ncbi:MAG: hybrid sensor histidine kinase/response regulator [Phenylobacterium zucineum]|nr:MAG: hybrid sensor histidine kinase/response regulator [Phenylobacterium zucineum]
MKAQAALLPYALMAFGVCLPVFVWAAGHAANAAWMSACFAGFAIAWGAFYGAVNWLRTPAATNPRSRARMQILGGLVWAAVIGQLAVFAHFAGPARETLLMLTLGAAMICVVFTTPWLPSLLVVAPAAVASPLIALFLHAEDLPAARLGLAATALALALALLVNRILRTQFALAAEREALVAERAAQAEAARRLARSKSDLVSTLSDEIRDGLTSVAHVLGSAVGSGRTAPSRQQIAAALDAVTELLAVLDTTVDAESAEAGRLSVELRPVDLAAIAGELVAAHRPAAAAKGLEITIHVEDAVARGAAVGDPVRARQVLGALIGNAVKFTVRGRVEVRLTRPSPTRIEIAVADTGPGLTDDELAAALQPFRRIARTSGGAAGAGLGLPLALKLARLMRGDLRAESAQGVGSCFTLALPFDPRVAADTRPPASAGREPAGRRLRILTLEPDALSAAMLRACLEQLGHQVVHAVHARRAVELARICDLDLVVSGEPEAIRALRALAGDAACTPVLALTSGEADENQAALDAGADALLRRPVAVPAAARAIGEALSSARAPANDRAVA